MKNLKIILLITLPLYGILISSLNSVVVYILNPIAMTIGSFIHMPFFYDSSMYQYEWFTIPFNTMIINNLIFWIPVAYYLHKYLEKRKKGEISFRYILKKYKYLLIGISIVIFISVVPVYENNSIFTLMLYMTFYLSEIQLDESNIIEKLDKFDYVQVFKTKYYDYTLDVDILKRNIAYEMVNPENPKNTVLLKITRNQNDEFTSAIYCGDILPNTTSLENPNAEFVNNYQCLRGFDDFGIGMSFVVISHNAHLENSVSLSPEEITLVLGVNNTVTWINHDDVGHAITSDEQPSWGSSGILKPGETFSVTFNQTGVYDYHGEPHPWITGKVIVLD